MHDNSSPPKNKLREQYRELMHYNTDRGLQSIEQQLKSLKKYEKQKVKLDKAYYLIYGGKEIFPKQEDVEKALTLKIEVEVAEGLKDQLKKVKMSNRLQAL